MTVGAQVIAKKTLAKRDSAKTPRKAVPNPTEQPKLHSGGNLQIAKGYGEAPVQAYVAGDAGLDTQGPFLALTDSRPLILWQARPDTCRRGYAKV